MAQSLKIFFLLCLLSFGEVFPVESLKKSSIKPAVEEMLTYHVDHKVFSPILVKRSFRLFISRFDPGKTYLMQSEALPYLEPTDKDIRATLVEYAKNDFKTYLTMSRTCMNAVHRARKIRATIRTQLLKSSSVDLATDLEYHPVHGAPEYASSEQALYESIEKMMKGWLNYFAKEHNKKILDAEEKLLVLNFFEKKRRQHEDRYLYNYGENPEENFALNVLKAISSSLDAHTMYFSPSEASEIRTSLAKEVHGVGIEISENYDGVMINSLLPKGPALRSGKIESGDRLVEIDDLDISTMSFREVLRRLEGPEFSKVKLAVQKKNGAKVAISLSREKIILDSDRISIDFEPFLDGVIGKINLSSFYDNGTGINVERDLREALKELHSQGPIYGLVIDMRKNAGGFLHQAVKVASLFSQSGSVVISKYANDEIQYTKSFDPRAFYEGPLVLLVSKASASAAEIVAQSLRDEGIAILVGDTTTYGKGSMQYQTITNPAAKNYFKVTVGRYFTISGKSPQMTGVPADIVISTEYAPYAIGEKYLQYPLSKDALAASVTVKDELQNLFKNYAVRAPSQWEKMIPILQQNAKARLASDANYQAFLSFIDNEQETIATFGQEDIHMQEGIAIIKDMILMQ